MKPNPAKTDRRPLKEQFTYEILTWKRMLEFMMEENSYLKNRLGEVLRTGVRDVELLENAEYYLTRFIKEDESIRFLRQDIEEQLVRLLQESAALPEGVDFLTQQQQRLRSAIESAGTNFNSMLFGFNSFLAGQVSTKG